MESSTWSHVRARRLARSSLAPRASAEELVDAAYEICGVQAQVQVSAELQLAGRVEGITQARLRAALWEQRLLVKAWTVRGTLHLHPAGDVALWYAARRAVLVSSQARPAELEAWRDPSGGVHPPLDAGLVEAIRDAIQDALDGRCLLRDELVDEIVKRVGPEPQQRLRSGFAFFLDEVCQGPPQGNRVTFVRPDQWIDGWQTVDERDALLEVCRRYLHAYGPARPLDFREWFSAREFSSDQARAIFDALGDELEEVDVDGHRAYVLAGDTAFPDPESNVRLLSEYDVFVMGFRERDRLIPESVREQVRRHPRGRYEGPAGVRLVLVDGIAAGLWERKRQGKRVQLSVALARKLTRAQRAELDREAGRIGATLGLEPTLTIE